MIDIRNYIFEYISDRMGLSIDDIKENSKLNYDLEMDSLDIIEMIMNFESELNIRVPDEKIIESETVGYFINLFTELINSKTKN